MSTTALPLASGTWTIDPVHSDVTFSVRHLGLAKVRGRFNDFSGNVVVGEDLASTAVTAEIDLESVDTHNPDRDNHLKSSDFFDIEANRVMTFRSTGVRGDGDSYTMDGELTVAGTTSPVSLDVEFFGTETFPADQSTRAGFTATTTLSRADLGITYDVPLGADKMVIGDKVSIELDIQLIAP
jgi:polyisoprenoid-binding protein YceI